MGKKEMNDDYCDIYEKKICDNCGKCLEEEGVDIRAIKIEEIAKKVEENEYLEAEYRNNLSTETEDDIIVKAEEESTLLVENEIKVGDNSALNEAYEKISLESGLDFSSLNNDEYEDAFDHIEYIEDYDLFDEGTLEDMTVEVFPGVRRLKSEK